MRDSIKAFRKVVGISKVEGRVSESLEPTVITITTSFFSSRMYMYNNV